MDGSIPIPQDVWASGNAYEAYIGRWSVVALRFLADLSVRRGLGGQGPAPGYVSSLPESRREVLCARLRAALPARADGSIPLNLGAWVIQARR